MAAATSWSISLRRRVHADKIRHDCMHTTWCVSHWAHTTWGLIILKKVHALSETGYDQSDIMTSRTWRDTGHKGLMTGVTEIGALGR